MMWCVSNLTKSTKIIVAIPLPYRCHSVSLFSMRKKNTHCKNCGKILSEVKTSRKVFCSNNCRLVCHRATHDGLFEEPVKQIAIKYPEPKPQKYPHLSGDYDSTKIIENIESGRTVEWDEDYLNSLSPAERNKYLSNKK